MKTLALITCIISMLFSTLKAQNTIDSAYRIYTYNGPNIPVGMGTIPTGLNLGNALQLDQASWFYIAACDSGIVLSMEIEFLRSFCPLS